MGLGLGLGFVVTVTREGVSQNVQMRGKSLVTTYDTSYENSTRATRICIIGRGAHWAAHFGVFAHLRKMTQNEIGIDMSFIMFGKCASPVRSAHP